MKPIEVTDEWLYQVMPLVDNALLAGLESSVDHEYTFSRGFEKKMKRLIRRTDHPVLHRFLRSVAAIALVLLLGGAGILAFSPEARAAVQRWMWYELNGSRIYYFADDGAAPVEWVPRYHIGWIPEGFAPELDDYDNNNGTIFYTIEEENEVIALNYSLMSSTSIGMFDPDGLLEPEELTINGMDALFYEMPAQDWCELIWIDEAQGLVFSLGTSLEREDCIRIAESVYAER